MRPDTFKILIGLLISMLISYAFYHYRNDEQGVVLAAGCLLELLLTLVPAIGFRFADGRKGALIKITGLIFGLFFIGYSIIFMIIPFSEFSYILLNGLTLLVYLLIIYNLYRASI